MTINERIALIAAGETVHFRVHGNSMIPRIYSGSVVTVQPVRDTSDLRPKDVVWCKVKGHLYTHLISAIRTKSGGGLEFQISNNKGRVNGWIGVDKIYGKVTEADGIPI